MARGFRIHSSAVFDPFSYQEMLAPIAQAQTAYNQMQDSLLAASEEANQYRQLIDSDEYASGILKGYNDALSEMSGKLSSEGLKTINRNSLLSLRRRYNNEVKPINDAAKTLASLQDMYRQAYAKDQTMMRGAMPSIRDLVENPGAMPQMVSGNDLYKQGAQAAQSSSSRIYNTDFGSRINGYIQQVAEQGYSPELVSQFIQDASSVPDLANAVQNIRQMYNTSGLEDGGYQADKYIMQGILDGMSYQRKENYVDDWQAKLATQFAYNQKAADAAYERQANLATLKAQLKAGASGSGSGSGSRVAYNSRLKDAWYIRDGKEIDLTTSDKKTLEEAMKNTNMITVSPSELTTENKVRVLKAIGIDAMDLTDGFGELNEDAIEEAFEYYSPFINSQYVLRQARAEDTVDASGKRIRRKNRKDEFLMIPKDIKRDADNPYLSDYGYESDDDITF